MTRTEIRRLVFALGTAGVALGWLAVGQLPSRAEAGLAAAAPDEGIFPASPGTPSVSIGGDVRVDGRPVSTTTFETRASPGDVIAFHRRYFEERAVDLVENDLPDGRALFVLDVREGRRCVVTARARGGVTEVIRGWSPLAADAPGDSPLLPALPEDVVAISRVEDGPALTWTGRATRDPRELGDDLRGRFVEGGWVAMGEDEVSEAEGVETRGFRFSKEGNEATLTVGALPEGGSLVVIRVLPGRG